MIRVPALCLVGCVGYAGLILSNDSPSFEGRLPPAKTEPAALEIRKLADPLFGPIQPRPEVPSSADDANSPLRDVRLTGVVIGPDLRIAIFAVSGADSLVLSEGETLKDWRLDRVSPGKVLLSGPAGTIKLEAKPDAKSGSRPYACCGPTRPGAGWCAGAANGHDSYACRQLIGSHPSSGARPSLLSSRELRWV